MPSVRQYYETPGAPFRVPTKPTDVASAWIGHRERLRRWIADIPEAAWTRATRCDAWTITDLVRHLVSGSQFLGYTLHEAKKQHATNLLADFDPQVTPAAAASQLAGLDLAGLLEALADVDGRVVRELDGFAGADWQLPAEAPMGQVPAYVSVNHFLFDSWVHERDLMLPLGESPTVEVNEVTAVATYVAALAGLAPDGADHALPRALVVDVALSGPDVRLTVQRDETVTTASVVASPNGGLTLEATAADFIDFATGRTPGKVDGDQAAMTYFRNFAAVLS